MMAGALAVILDLEDELKGNWIPENFAVFIPALAINV